MKLLMLLLIVLFSIVVIVGVIKIASSTNLTTQARTGCPQLEFPKEPICPAGQTAYLGSDNKCLVFKCK